MIYRTLIEAPRLAAHLDDADWRVFDVRHQLVDVDAGERAYLAGHVSGAHFLHCDRDLSGEKDGRNGRHPLPDPAKLVARLVACGVGAETQVVVYDDSQGMIAGRLWWLLRWLGHERVAVLDGGLQAWLASDGELTDVIPDASPGAMAPVLRPQAKAEADEILGNIGQGRFVVVDARSPDRYRGENETIDPVAGHIPGAVNRFFRDNLNADGCFKPVEILRQEWRALLGVFSPERVVHQCGSGISACHNLLAMEHAGLTGSRLYPGSWSEWCADSARPVAR